MNNLTTPTAANDNTIISVKRVCEMTSLSRAAIGKFRRAGRFPQPVQLGEKRIGFVKAEVDVWIDTRIAARTAA